MSSHFLTTHPTIVVVAAGRATDLAKDGATSTQLAGMISISDPAPHEQRPPKWLRDPAHEMSLQRRGVDVLHVDMEDVEQETWEGCDDINTIPSEKHVMSLLAFARRRANVPGRLLIHCAAGRSRSTAAAFIILCDRLGPGNEKQAMTELLAACERTPLPNTLLTSIADHALGCGGRLHAASLQQNNEPVDCGLDEGKKVTGTALLKGVRDGTIK